MAHRAKGFRDIPPEAADIGALGTADIKGGAVGPAFHQRQGVDEKVARFELDRFAGAGPRIGALPVHLQGGIGGRALADGAGEVRQDRADRLCRWAGGALRHHIAFRIIRAGGGAERDGEAIGLGPVQQIAGQFRRLAKGDGQHARRQRVKRAAMTDLHFAMAARFQRPFQLAHDLRAAGADRLVDHQPAVKARHCRPVRTSISSMGEGAGPSVGIMFAVSVMYISSPAAVSIRACRRGLAGGATRAGS